MRIATAAGPISLVEHGQGAPLLLLHGIQGTARTWDAVGAVLAETQRVVAPDLRGRGASLAPDDPEAYCLPGFADDLQAVLEWIGQPAVLVAWSMGVLVALQRILTHGGRDLRGLVLASGSACLGDDARWFQGATADEVAQEARERAERLALVEAAAPHAVASSWQHARQVDFRPLLPQLTVPTLVIHGIDDDQCPVAHGRLLAAQIPGARLDAWRDTGHNPMAKDPQRFAAAVNTFVAAI